MSKSWVHTAPVPFATGIVSKTGVADCYLCTWGKLNGITQLKLVNRACPDHGHLADRHAA